MLRHRLAETLIYHVRMERRKACQLRMSREGSKVSFDVAVREGSSQTAWLQVAEPLAHRDSRKTASQ